MKRLLFLSHRLPYPPDKGERVRAYHELVNLSRRFRVTLASGVHDEVEESFLTELGRLCEAVLIERPRFRRLRSVGSLITGRSATEGYFACPRLSRRLAEAHECRPFDVIFAYCSSTFPVAQNLKGVPVVMDFVDIDSEKWRGFGRCSWGAKRWLYKLEAKRVHTLEIQAIDYCRHVFCVSSQEAQNSPHGLRVQGLRNGVDLEYFRPTTPSVAGRRIIFTGTMDYRPNVSAVCWFADNVWGRLRTVVPGVTFDIVGRNPHRKVLALRQINGINVTGAVSDIRPLIASADVAVAPMLMGRGVQNKILEAMAMAKPVVATPLALEGINASAGVEVLTAQEPEEWVERIAMLMRDVMIRRRVGLRARLWVERNCRWWSCLDELVATCIRAAEGDQGIDTPVVEDDA